MNVDEPPVLSMIANPLPDGTVTSIGDEKFTWLAGVLRQQRLVSAAQSQTAQTFGFKWARTSSYEIPDLMEFSRGWLRQRYLGSDPDKRAREIFFEGAKVLDAGCGSGYSALLLIGDLLSDVRYLGVDISTAVDVARERFRKASVPGMFLQADFGSLAGLGDSFDVVLAEGTLHHSDDTRASFLSVARLLAPGGRLMAYVYRKKGPIREFTDDLIRDYLKGLDDESAWEALRPLTELGEALGKLGVVVDVPRGIPFLGIEAGPIDVQRLFYYHVVKLFFRPDLDLETMNHVNFDWFRPSNAHRHTEDEVRGWLEEASLVEERLVVEPSGITVLGRRPGKRSG